MFSDIDDFFLEVLKIIEVQRIIKSRSAKIHKMDI